MPSGWTVADEICWLLTSAGWRKQHAAKVSKLRGPVDLSYLGIQGEDLTYNNREKIVRLCRTDAARSLREARRLMRTIT